MNKKLKIFIVEDHPIVLEGLNILLDREDDFEVCGVASDCNTALARIHKLNPDIVVTDISLKNSSSGIDLTTRLSVERPEIKVLVLSMFDEKLYAERALKAGARGYLMKDAMVKNIIDAIKQISGGSVYVSEEMKSVFITGYINKDKHNSIYSPEVLTNRELEVLKLTGRGISSAKAAKLMEISTKTVDTYKYRIKEKLNLKDNTELIRLGIDIINKEELS